MPSVGLTKKRNVKDLFVLFQSVNLKKLFQLIKNNLWVDVFALRKNFVILLAYVDLIKSSKFSGHPESKAVFMRENII